MNKVMNKVVGGIGVLVLAGFVAACSSPMGSSADASATRAGARTIASPLAPGLGSAASFAVFGGGAGVTNQGIKTQIIGDMGSTGVSTMITGFHSPSFVYTETPLNVGGIDGLVYTNAPQGSASDFAYATAVAGDALAAFNALAAIPDGTDPGAGQLGGLTLVPGVYKSLI